MSEILRKLDELNSNVNNNIAELGARVGDMEKRLARLPDDGGDASTVSFGRSVAMSPDVRAITSANRASAIVKLSGESAAITSANASVGAGRSQGTSLVPGHRIPEILTPYQRSLTIRDLIPQARTTSNTIEWPRETGFTNNAAPVAEGAAKPYSDLTFDMTSAPVRTIAHLFKASRQILDDADALAAYIERRGVYGLKFVEENQLLNGNGTGQNLHGVIPQATAFVAPFTAADDTPIDRLNQAAAQAEIANVPVSGIVLNPLDWRKIIGLKDAGSNYISPDAPFAQTAHRLWNLPVVATQAIPAGKFLVGAFNDGAQIFDRLDVEVLVSTENADDFEKNLVSIRIEERLALAVYRPEAFIFGDLEA